MSGSQGCFHGSEAAAIGLGNPATDAVLHAADYSCITRLLGRGFDSLATRYPPASRLMVGRAAELGLVVGAEVPGLSP